MTNTTTRVDHEAAKAGAARCIEHADGLDPDLLALAHAYFDIQSRLEAAERVVAAAEKDQEYVELRTSFKKCHSVDGHGMRGTCDCHYKEQVAANLALRNALAAWTALNA